MLLNEIATATGVYPKYRAGTHGGEYHSACPACGGKDRFVIQPHHRQKNCSGRYFCRQCKIFGDSIQFCVKFLGYGFKDALAYLGIPSTHNVVSYLTRLINITPEASITKPPDAWQKQAAEFIKLSHEILLRQQHILKRLEQRGLPIDAVKRYKIGWCPNNTTYSSVAWGLPENTKNLWFPQGIVIPTLEKEKVIRIKIRREKHYAEDTYSKYLAISGSMSGLNIIGNQKLNTVIVVESELDGYALHHAVGDIACIIATGSSSKNPDSLSNFLIKSKPTILIYDDDTAGEKMMQKWLTYYPHLHSCKVPIGKDIGEYIQAGGDIALFVQQIINNIALGKTWQKN